MAQLNHEPSMEDILASIKRIIAEDSEAVAPRAPRPIRREAVMPTADPFGDKLMSALAERTVEPVPVETEQADVVPESAAPAETADILELTSPIADDIAPVEQPATAPVSIPPISIAPVAETTPEQPEPKPAPKEPVAAMDRLMSDPAAQASRSAFAALTQLQVRADAGQENTLEGLVADMLRPMLREWLDRELPAMVERLVAEEISRVSGRA